MGFSSSSALRWRSPSSVTHCVRSLRWAATQVLHCLPRGLQKVRIPTNPPRAPGFVGKFPFSQSLKSHIFRQKHNNPIILSEKIHKVHLKTKKALYFFPTKHPQNLRLVGKKSQPPPQNPNFFRQIPASHSVLSEKTHLPRPKKGRRQLPRQRRPSNLDYGFLRIIIAQYEQLGNRVSYCQYFVHLDLQQHYNL